ncbi:MAG: homocysteine S-methyltransferase family protein [Pseudomonadota bacterium]
MSTPKYRTKLPQLTDTRLLTDGGIETTLIFHEKIDLPYFAAFTLLETEEGTATLRRYYERYIDVAHRQNTGLVLDSATWRASRDWGQLLGYDAEALAALNAKAIDLLFDLRWNHQRAHPFVISGNIGPRGDGYVADELLTSAEAAEYHADQIAVFARSGADMVSAITMTHAGEAAGIAQTCAKYGMPLALAFTVEVDGRLPSGQTLGDAIAEVDGDGSAAPSYYMINCAHPDHFFDVIDPGSPWASRIRGLRANASRQSHEELDNAETLDDGDPLELARDYARLLDWLPNLRVFGGCCGTDHRHIEAIGASCIGAPVC